MSLREIWRFNAIIEATEQQAEKAKEAIQRTLCPDELHPGPCETPWLVYHTRLSELEGADKANWEASFDEDRVGQETKEQRQYRDEAVVAGDIGRALLRQELARVTVRLPKALADQAVASWQRDSEEAADQPETHEQRAVRGRAAALSLIGLSITERGKVEGDEVVVDLAPELVGTAVDAADSLPSEVEES